MAFWNKNSPVNVPATNAVTPEPIQAEAARAEAARAEAARAEAARAESRIRNFFEPTLERIPKARSEAQASALSEKQKELAQAQQKSIIDLERVGKKMIEASTAMGAFVTNFEAAMKDKNSPLHQAVLATGVQFDPNSAKLEDLLQNIEQPYTQAMTEQNLYAQLGQSMLNVSSALTDNQQPEQSDLDIVQGFYKKVSFTFNGHAHEPESEQLSSKLVTELCLLDRDALGKLLFMTGQGIDKTSVENVVRGPNNGWGYVKNYHFNTATISNVRPELLGDAISIIAQANKLFPEAMAPTTNVAR